MSASTSKPRGELIFEAEGHVYTLDGVRLPGVTEVIDSILTDWTGIPRHIRDQAMERGRYVHECVALAVRNRLDIGRMHEPFRAYFVQFERFLNDSGHTVLASEQRVVHRAYGYAGTLDLHTLDKRAGEWVIDVKTGTMPPAVGPQVAAYDEAKQHEAKQMATTRMRRGCLLLTETLYRLHELKDRSDFAYFQSALNCFKWRRKHGID